MRRSTDRILTTHTGSLPRPSALKALYIKRQAGESVDAGVLDTQAAAAIDRIVDRQVAAGVDVGNDGEQGREGFFLYMMRRLGGFASGTGWKRPLWEDMERYPLFHEQRNAERASKASVQARDSNPEAIADITHLSSEPINRECAAFTRLLEAKKRPFAETFMTAPSPGILAKALRNRHYDSERAYLAALGRAMREEYEAIVRHGFVLQIDAPDLALERHAAYKGQPLSAFLDFAEATVATINDALINVPRDRVRIHVCWGNYEGPHDSDVPLADILPTLLKARVGGFVLPFGNARHGHEPRLFEKHRLADDQILVAGVIDTLVNVVEHPEYIAERLERVAQVIGDPKRVLAGTDCGFDTAAGSGRIADDVVWGKLASLRDGAKLASQRLFRH
jgi:5-methyltetrahydropteroyltriglutamate--homocysteine methyltransferase